MQPLCQPIAMGTQSFIYLQNQTDSCLVRGAEILGKCPDFLSNLIKV